MRRRSLARPSKPIDAKKSSCLYIDVYFYNIIILAMQQCFIVYLPKNNASFQLELRGMVEAKFNSH